MFEFAVEARLSGPPLNGAWAVGVSGGADSMALLALLCDRSDLRLHVVHLNHETRGSDSDADADFVRQAAARLNLPCTVARLGELSLDSRDWPNNPAARYRAARMNLFRRVVRTEGLQGVLLAHHADDQAETVLQRILRGSAPAGLGGIRPQSLLGDLLVLHPLLGVARESLRQFLVHRNITWREDASNDSPRYLRNRLRSLLQPRPVLREALLSLASAGAAWHDWLDRAAAPLPETFSTALLSDGPDPLALHAARRWLLERGVPGDQLSHAVLARLLEMARDAASSPRQHFPGGLLVCRRQNRIFMEARQSS